MSYCVSNLIGIRTGGVFSGDTDVEDMKERITKIIAEMKEGKTPPDIKSLSHCMSGELVAHKGAYVVIAGVFNYWSWDQSSEFSKRLSQEFGTEVMHMAWDEELERLDCAVFLDGRSLHEVQENPLGRIVRRVF